MVLQLPAGMQAHLDSNATTICYCWRLVLNSGTIKGFTNHDNDITFDGVTYYAETGFSPSSIKHAIGNAVDDMEVLGFLSADALEEDDILNKLYDNAEISVFAINWKDLTQRALIFKGYLGTITTGTQSFVAEVRSLRQMLLLPQGRRYLKLCDAQLGDSRCKVNLTTLPNARVDGSVNSVYSQKLFDTTTSAILALATGWFSGGKITWLTGSNAGYACEIKGYNKRTTAWLDLWEVIPAPIQVGDTFTLQVGCDKQITTCKAKFDNVANFRGFPRMPGADIALKFATNTRTAFANFRNGGSWYKN